MEGVRRDNKDTKEHMDTDQAFNSYQVDEKTSFIEDDLMDSSNLPSFEVVHDTTNLIRLEPVHDITAPVREESSTILVEDTSTGGSKQKHTRKALM
ncbi:hypothetical protein ACSBR2_017445 [Camellia fascicularis]